MVEILEEMLVKYLEKFSMKHIEKFSKKLLEARSVVLPEEYLMDLLQKIPEIENVFLVGITHLVL